MTDDEFDDGPPTLEWFDEITRDLTNQGVLVPVDEPAPIAEYDPPTDVDLLVALPAQTLAFDCDRPDLAWARRQMEAATLFALARQHADQDRVTARAAVILAARWDSPEAEQLIGVRCHTGEYRGQRVGCRLCNETFAAGIDGDYYEATSATDGLCFGCVLRDTRTDDAQLEVVGVPVPASSQRAPRRRPSRRTRTAGE